MAEKNKALFDELARLQSEQRNPATENIDLADSLEIVQLLSVEDQKVAHAVAACHADIAKAIDYVTQAFRTGGRLIYVGAGTSGRLGVLDAAECPPTFGAPPSQVQGIIAGGDAAMFVAQEGAEDSLEHGQDAIIQMDVSARDVVCGLAASGRTPFVHGALREAQKRGAVTMFIVCVPKSQLKLASEPEVIIAADVGPEAIMGSTRLKSGTAQKMICNMITTGAFIRSGKIYKNVMVDLMATNQKLHERARRIVHLVTGLSYDDADSALKQADGNVKKAIFMHYCKMNADEADAELKTHQGFLRKALEAFHKTTKL